MKANITLNKFKHIFRTKSVATIEELQQNLQGLTKQYLEYIGLDEKPAKGERKLADEQVLLISDVIDSFDGVATSS